MIARAMGQPSKSAADAVAELIADLEQPGNLRAVGVTRDHFNAIATGAMQNFHVRANPRPISSTKDIIEILEMAYWTTFPHILEKAKVKVNPLNMKDKMWTTTKTIQSNS